MKREKILALAIAFAAVLTIGVTSVLADCGGMHKDMTTPGTVSPQSEVIVPGTDPGIREGLANESVQDGLLRSQVPGESYRNFVIGFKQPDIMRCEVQEIAASSPSEALSYAKMYCPECSVTDLSGLHGRGEAPWEINQRIADFCG